MPMTGEAGGLLTCENDLSVSYEYFDWRLPWSFWEKTEVDPVTGCWMWIGGKSGNGYGSCWDMINKCVRPAHKHAYEVLVGPVGERLVLDHETCSRPLCVRPDHMVPTTIAANAHRERGNWCRSGRHELTPDNERWRGGFRQCRTCHNERRNELRKERGRRD
jgi:hypothetical protein